MACDYYSNWLEMVKFIYDSTAPHVITAIKSMLARWKISLEIASDNGPPFNYIRTSYTDQQFAKHYNFVYTTSSSLHPPSNGLTEKVVSIAKNVLHKSQEPNAALMEYRNMPLMGGTLSPSQLMLDQLLRTKLPTTMAILLYN